MLIEVSQRRPVRRPELFAHLLPPLVELNGSLNAVGTVMTGCLDSRQCRSAPRFSDSLHELSEKAVVRLLESTIEKAGEVRDDLVHPVGGVAPEDCARGHSFH